MGKLWQLSRGYPKPAFSKKTLEKILVQKTAPKVPEWLSYGNLSKVTQNRHFLNKYKMGTKGNFSKIAQKVALPWKAQKHSKGKWLSTVISMHF